MKIKITDDQVKMIKEDYNSFVNMGELGTEQEMNTNEQEGYSEEMSSVYKELGALRAMVAHGILGWMEGERGLRIVSDNDVLTSETKEEIRKTVEDLSGGNDNSENVGDNLMESKIDRYRKDFMRLIKK